MSTKKTVINDPIMEPYFIEMDTECYGLFKNTTSEQGRTRPCLVGFYSNLEACLDNIAEDHAKQDSYLSLADFIATYAEKLEQLKGVKALKLKDL